MSSVGSYLRELRERRGVSLEEIARTTRVGRSYLEALEAGEFGKLPAPVFTRGFVVAYCQALGVSSDEALTRFVGQAAPVSDAKVEPTSVRERRSARGRGPVLVSFILLIVLGLALFAVALVLQSGREVDDRRADATRGVLREDPPQPVTRPEPVASENAATIATPQNVAPTAAEAPAPPAGTPGATPPAAPAVPQVSAGNPAPTSSPTTALATKEALPSSRPATAVAAPVAAATATPPVPANATLSQKDATAALAAVTSPPYRLIARTTASTWLRVRTDDGRVSDETVPAGQVREWVSNRPFTISVGNAGGVRLELNGRPLPVLGPVGAVIGRLVLPAEIP